MTKAGVFEPQVNYLEMNNPENRMIYLQFSGLCQGGFEVILQLWSQYLLRMGNNPIHHTPKHW